MANVLDDLAVYITSQSPSFAVLGGSTPIQKGRIQDTPDTVIALIEIISFEPPIETFGASGSFGGWERPQIQILSRSRQNDYLTARNNAETMYKIVRSVYGTINGTQYHYIQPRSSPYYLGEDDNSRHLITFTVDVWKDSSS